MSVFTSSLFYFLRNPRGGVEDLAAMKAGGCQGVFCNVGDYPASEWATVQTRAHANGMFCGPWARTADAQGSFSQAVLDLLVATAEAWNSPLVVNSEKEIDGSGSTYTSKIAQAVQGMDAALSMEPIPFANVDWTPLARVPVLPQIFPAEQGTHYDPISVRDLWWSYGIECVYMTYGTYGGAKPSDYVLKSPYSLFTGDDIPYPKYAAWAPTSSGWEGCNKVPETQWYEKPYLTGPPVGPEKLPRALYPPSAGKGTFSGDDVMAFKRAISRAGRQTPWSPSTWSYTYGETFAKGDGSGQVGKSGVRGFQRQQWPNDKDMQTGNLGDKTYQSIRRALVSNPDAPNFKEPLLDGEAIKLLKQAADELDSGDDITNWRKAVCDFCTRAEKASDVAWVYTQARPFSGLGVPPEQNHANDCSSYAILAYYWAKKQTGLPVPDPSGYQYAGYGNTWDNLDGHPKVTSGNYLVGDLAHYDGHVTICKKAGDKDSSRWSSFGSEPKPIERTLFYRSDFSKVVRPPLA